MLASGGPSVPPVLLASGFLPWLMSQEHCFVVGIVKGVLKGVLKGRRGDGGESVFEKGICVELFAWSC